MKRLLIAAGLLFFGFSAFANDSAVEVSAGGLKLRKENSVLMEKERLYISRDLIRVEYEFRNTTNNTITSEVAFPIPVYNYRFDEEEQAPDFADFKAWVEGKPIKVKKEVRAFMGNSEITDELRKAGITIEKFGNFEPDDNKGAIQTLKQEFRDKLIKLGALNEELWPQWEVNIKYHWRQKFPPSSVVRIRHEYRPVCGFHYYKVQDIETDLKDACPNIEVIKELRDRVAVAMAKDPKGTNNYYYVFWVSYILTTANSWQTPIKDFEIIVECKNEEISAFCWDGQFEKIDGKKYRASKKDFIPTKELKVYFVNSL
jgi:hypothetical protein